MLPIYSIKHNSAGYAFIVIDYSQEHDLYFVVTLQNGEIWTLNNKEIRFQNNITLNRILNSVDKEDKQS